MPKVYKLTETTDQAVHYHIVPPLKVAIPVAEDSREVLNALLQDKKTVHLPTGLADYPIVTRKQLELFTDYRVLTVKVTYLKFKPYIKGELESAISLPNMKLILSLKKD